LSDVFSFNVCFSETLIMPFPRFFSWRYGGFFKNGLEHGLGKYVWRGSGEDGDGDGDEWDGEWKLGKRTDRGTYTRGKVKAWPPWGLSHWGEPRTTP
jgi:hypothetical protein